MAQTNEGVELARIISTVLGLGAARALPMEGANFGPARKPGREFVLTANNNPKRPQQALPNIDVATGLAEAMREEPIDFDAGIVYIPGSAQNNAGFVDTPENKESFLRQTVAEHSKALNEFNKDNLTQLTPEKKIQLGIKNEEGLVKWWNDKSPRRPVTPTSSCVSKARIGPNGDIYITFGSGNKEYQYEGSSDPVQASRVLQELVTSKSIGKAVNSRTGDWGRAHTYLPKG